jgi:catechol 2,3-dioxygenase-like lactoylglutathione lyase family enzyme
MRFRSNTCVAVHVRSLAKAEHFYGDVLGFRLRKRTKTWLEFDTGALRLFVNRSARAQPPTPSFGVRDVAKAKRLLKGAGCRIVVDRGGSFYFKDPLGFVFDVIEG